MSLFTTFKNVIATFGMEKLTKPIFNNSKIAIRFNIGDNGNDAFIDRESENMSVNPDYISACLDRVLKIYNSMSNAPDLLVIEGYTINGKSAEKFVSSVLTTTGLPYPDEINSEIVREDHSEYNHLFLLWNLNDFQPDKLLREIILCDFEVGNYLLSSSVYFVSTTDKVLFHLYDDRGVDLVADKKEKIQNIYDELNDLISDYNVEEIDTIFKSTAE